MNTVRSPDDDSPPADPVARIRPMNDALRRTGAGGRIVMTAGVAALPRDAQLAIVAAVMAFEAFDADNDPYGEHDFGALQVEAHRIFWKIDPCDQGGRVHSPDAADPAVTRRVLTVMLAEEY